MNRAVANRGAWHASGHLVWRWKQRARQTLHSPALPILPAMPTPQPKVAARPLAFGNAGCHALRRLRRQAGGGLAAQGTGSSGYSAVGSDRARAIGDDAAVVQVAAGHVALSCDGFRAMIDDAYRFGRVCAHHALNDLFAMDGAQPTFALALASVPVMAGRVNGRGSVSDACRRVVGVSRSWRRPRGRSHRRSRGTGLAFTVTGAINAEPLTKDGLSARRKSWCSPSRSVPARCWPGAMPRSRPRRRPAWRDRQHGCVPTLARRRFCAATASKGVRNVTGFGLAGHLSEMTRAGGVRRKHSAWPSAVPARRPWDMFATDIVSSLQSNNEQALDDFVLRKTTPDDPTVRLLAGPADRWRPAGRGSSGQRRRLRSGVCVAPATPRPRSSAM